MASFYHASLLNHASLASALSFLLAAKLSDRNVPAMLLREVCDDVYRADQVVIEAAAADSLAHYDRDPACRYYSLPLLNFKGFQAVQAYRVAHWLWQRQRRALALFLQNRIASVFDVDIHPAATIGWGLMVDHGTGVVIGETAQIGNNVSMLHSVTLGGSGTTQARRHPQIGDGVLIASGAKLLGPIEVGRGRNSRRQRGAHQCRRVQHGRRRAGAVGRSGASSRLRAGDESATQRRRVTAAGRKWLRRWAAFGAGQLLCSLTTSRWWCPLPGYCLS